MNNDLDNNFLDENDYTLTEIFYVLKKHKNKVLFSFISVLFISFLYTLISKQVFETTLDQLKNIHRKSYLNF